MRIRLIAALILCGLSLSAASQAGDPSFKAQALLEQGVALMKSGQPEAAEPLLRQSVLLRPDNALGYFYLGSAQMAQQKFEETAQSMGEALRLEARAPSLGRQNRREAQDDLGLALAFQKNYAEARKVYEKALEDDPDHAPFSYNLACVEALAGDRKDALASLRRAMDADAKSPAGKTLPDPAADTDLKGLWGDPVFQATLIMNLGSQPTDGPGSALVREGARLLAGGDWTGAEAKEADALKAEPKSPRALFFLAGALEGDGRMDEAARTYRKAVEADLPPNVLLSKPMVRHAWLCVGRAELAASRFKEAAEAFEAARQQDPYRPQAFYGQAQAYAGLGDQAKAGEALKRAFALRDEAIALDLPLPDPAKDPAFAKWAQDKDWQALLAGL